MPRKEKTNYENAATRQGEYFLSSLHAEADIRALAQTHGVEEPWYNLAALRDAVSMLMARKLDEDHQERLASIAEMERQLRKQLVE